MKLLFTICGRAGSKGIANKNVNEFLGIPLPLYTISVIDLYLKKHTDIWADVVVSSDSKELLEIVQRNPFFVTHQIERNAELSTDKASKIAVVCDCLKKMEQRGTDSYDMVVDLDITSPLRTVGDLERLIKKQDSTGCDVAFSVTTARRNPYFNQVKKVQKGYKRVLEYDFTARQEAPEVFDMNASMYAYRPDYLRKAESVLEGYCEVIEMYDTGVLDLDHENDFELMQVIAEYLFKEKAGLKEIWEHLLDAVLE